MTTRTDLIDNLAHQTGLSKKESGDLLVTVSSLIQEQLAATGESVLPGFGKFKLVERAARKGHNPKTGESLDIPAKTAVKFKVSAGQEDQFQGSAE